MKKYSFFKMVKITLITLIIGSVFTSCLNNNKTVDVQLAGIALINAAPGSPNLDLIGDGQLEYLPVPFAYDTTIAYLRAYPGYRVFGFTLHNSYKLLVSQQFYLKPGNAYSIFITDTLGAAKLVSLEDSLQLTDSSKAYVRFANMSPDAPNLNLNAGNDATPLFTNIAFTKSGDFTPIAPADNYSFTISAADANTTLASLNNVSLKAGKVYTIWARGLANTTTDSLKLGLSMMANRW